jgi:Ala-tRNA(Pro) deacylase
MPATPDQLLARLTDLGIAATTHHHAPVFTVAEAQALRGTLPGGHCKSLFLRDKAGGHWLAVMQEDRAISVNALARALGAPSSPPAAIRPAWSSSTCCSPPAWGRPPWVARLAVRQGRAHV